MRIGNGEDRRGVALTVNGTLAPNGGADGDSRMLLVRSGRGGGNGRTEAG
jgi:hypothetical protein